MNEAERNVIKKTYNKKNKFEFNIIFNEKGEAFERIIERAFCNWVKT